MAFIVNYMFGKMISAMEKSTGRPYDDWRKKYLDWPGLIVVGESEHRDPGGRFVYLYPSDPDNIMQPYFHSSIGCVEQNDGLLTCTTKNSIYTFSIGDEGLDDRARQELIMLVSMKAADHGETENV